MLASGIVASYRRAQELPSGLSDWETVCIGVVLGIGAAYA